MEAEQSAAWAWAGLEKEFDSLSVPCADRDARNDECLAIAKCFWPQRNPEFHGRFHDFEGVHFYPNPLEKSHIPIWVGRHTRRAIRRAVAYGDAWQLTRQTPQDVADLLPYLRQQAK